ncbi:MAG TPA: TonB family protein [Chthoniobacterales bacterium]|nr:TonB family protein [Chthoniobacterales bacterium]
MSKRKKITLAVIASLLLHLFLFLAVVGYYTIFPPPANPKATDNQDTPQLTILDTPPDKAEQQYVRTEDDQKTDQKQDNAPFQSDKDTAAASEKQSNEQAPLPTQDGKSLESLMFRNNDFSLAMNGQDYSRNGADGGENAASTPAPTPDTTPTPAPTAKDDDLAMLRPTPTPLPTPNPNKATNNQNRPGAPRTAYRPQNIITRMQGNIGNRGRSSVSALGTPQGRFQKAVEDAVGSLWYYFVQQRSDLLTIGTVRIEFVVSPSGEVVSARVVSNSSNETLATRSLQSIRQAKIPPMPQELIPLVPERGLEFTFSFNYM